MRPTCVRFVIFAVFVAATAVATPPRVVAYVVSLPTASVADADRDAAAALLIAKTLSARAVVAEMPTLLADRVKSCQAARSDYLSCTALSPSQINSQSLVEGADADIVLICFFSPSPKAGWYRGTYYLIPTSGSWRGSSFSVTRVQRSGGDEVMVVRAPVRRHAEELGLDVPASERIPLPTSPTSNWYVDAVFPVPPELR